MSAFVHTGPLKPIYVPLDEMADHPILRFARIIDDEVTWPKLSGRARSSFRKVTVVTVADGRRVVSLPPRVNLDFFVDQDTDEEAPPFWQGRAEDIQRFYIRTEEMIFGHIDTFTAVTINGIRRYFVWRDVLWSEIELRSFLDFRDSAFSYFEEISVGNARATSAGTPNTPDGVGFFLCDQEEFARAVATPPKRRVLPALSTEEALAQQGRAIAVATLAHRGQTDLLGYPHLDHVARVASSFDPLRHPYEHCAAWLGDTLTDADVTAVELLSIGVLPAIVEIIELLTRRHIPESDFFALLRRHQLARTIRLAQIDDNQVEWRVRQLQSHDRDRLRTKYVQERDQLLFN